MMAVKSQNNEIRKRIRVALGFHDAIKVAENWIFELYNITKQDWEIVEVCRVPNYDINNRFTGTW